jgi:hypothetical protein
LRSADESLTPPDEHLANTELLTGLGPSADEPDLARRIIELVDGLDVVLHGSA